VTVRKRLLKGLHPVTMLPLGPLERSWRSAVLPLAATQRSVVGTPSYMAPEMALGDGSALSERTDVFLLGAVLYHLLTGYVPFSPEDLAGEQHPPPPVHPWRLLPRGTEVRREITPEAAAA
jgi:serine/threonine protein kinase